jgi:pyruvate/2-oxoacid:ferredoxin oxidoreductase alpha subunit
MKKLLKGNSAVAYGVKLARAEVIAAYPITPQTSIIEDLAAFVAKGELQATFVKVESEHSAMAACIGAASAGARVFTATSAQGLALMHELIHWAAGARLPIVLADVNRAMAPGWSIWTDQNDTLSQRDTGWMQLYCASSQEVVDSVVQAYKVAEKVLLPVMIVLDAFFLSHTHEVVDVPEQTLVDRFLPPLDLPLRLDVDRPGAFGNLVFPDRYMEFRFKIELALREALEVWREVDREWGELVGRSYGLLEAYRREDAETVLLTAGTPASTGKVAVDQLRQEGIPVGLVRLRLFRPFPAAELERLLSGLRRVVVLDRNCSYGHHGIFHQEVKSALYELPERRRPQVLGVVAGLGGRDITVADLAAILRQAHRGELAAPVTWWNVLQPEEEAVALAVAK